MNGEKICFCFCIQIGACICYTDLVVRFHLYATCILNYQAKFSLKKERKLK